jgi:hypothetical protein
MSVMATAMRQHLQEVRSKVEANRTTSATSSP